MRPHVTRGGGDETVKVDGVKWKPPGLANKARWKTGVLTLLPFKFIELSQVKYAIPGLLGILTCASLVTFVLMGAKIGK